MIVIWLFIVLFFHLFTGNPKTRMALQNCPKLGQSDQPCMSLHPHDQSSDGAALKDMGMGRAALQLRQFLKVFCVQRCMQLGQVLLTGASEQHITVPTMGTPRSIKKLQKLLPVGTLFPLSKKNKQEGRSYAPM